MLHIQQCDTKHQHTQKNQQQHNNSRSRSTTPSECVLFDWNGRCCIQKKLIAIPSSSIFYAVYRCLLSVTTTRRLKRWRHPASNNSDKKTTCSNIQKSNLQTVTFMQLIINNFRRTHFLFGCRLSDEHFFSLYLLSTRPRSIIRYGVSVRSFEICFFIVWFWSLMLLCGLIKCP